MHETYMHHALNFEDCSNYWIILMAYRGAFAPFFPRLLNHFLSILPYMYQYHIDLVVFRVRN